MRHTWGRSAVINVFLEQVKPEQGKVRRFGTLEPPVGQKEKVGRRDAAFNTNFPTLNEYKPGFFSVRYIRMAYGDKILEILEHSWETGC